MDRSEESKAKAEILQRTLESVCVKLQAEKGFTSEQIGLALSATGLKFLSEAWSGEQIVAHLAGLTTALADMHDIAPETGRVGTRATRN